MSDTIWIALTWEANYDHGESLSLPHPRLIPGTSRARWAISFKEQEDNTTDENLYWKRSNSNDNYILTFAQTIAL